MAKRKTAGPDAAPCLSWHNETRRLADLVPFQENPRQLTEKGRKDLQQSLDRFGMADMIIVNTDGTICGGHQRYYLLQEAGTETIDVRVPDRPLTEDEFRELNIRLNKNVAGKWDADLLSEFFSPDELQQWGFTPEELKELKIATADDATGTDQADDDAEVEIQDGPTVTATNDLYEITIGSRTHRLLVGDSTVKADVDRLLAGRKVDCLMTDPPYGVKYEGGTGLTIQNDGLDDYNAFFHDFLAAIPWADYNTAYIFMSCQELHTLRISAEKAGLTWSDYLVWVKDRFVLGRKDYNAQHEHVYYGWFGRHRFYGDSTCKTLLDSARPLESLSREELIAELWEWREHYSSVIRHPRPHKNDIHPTMKPVDMIVRLLKQGSDYDHLVFDPFGGSGTTLLACQKTQRTACLMEKDPRYADAIIRRLARWAAENQLAFALRHLNGERTADDFSTPQPQ